MFIPILILITPIIFAPVWLSSIYHLEIDWWENQISADNLAIQLGREDRQMLNLEEKKRTKMRAAHQAYHQALACSVIPATALKCLELSKRLNSVIRFLKSNTERVLNSMWHTNGVKALNRIAASGRGFRLARTSALLLTWENCPLCQMPLSWKLSPESLRSLFVLQKDPRIRSASIVFLKTSFKWEYRLFPN